MTWLQAITKGGYTWRGQMRYLVGRVPDPSACHGCEASSETVERALDIICESFAIPPAQRYCLRPADNLLAIYESITWLADDMEFERLFISLEDERGRPITLQEHKEIVTVADVIKFVGGN